MNWEAIGAVGEILGAAAVVISLIYLASQIRTQNREARLAGMHEISVGFRDSIATICDSDMAELLVRANADFDALSDAEVLRILGMAQRVMRVWEEAFYQFNQGRLDTHIWEAMNRQYSSFLGAPAMQRVWVLRRDFFSDEFRSFVDACQSTPYAIR